MHAPAHASPTPFLKLEILAMAKPWEGLLAPLSGFPVPAPELSLLKSFLQRLNGELMQPRESPVEVFLQFNQLHLADGAARLANNARVWKPQHGLGVWPDRPAPTLWTREDFESPPHGMPPPMMYRVFRISGARGVKDRAMDVMLGLGTVIEILTEGPGDAFLAQAKKLLYPSIQERALRKFPLYMPLLERKSVEGAPPEKLVDWFCGASTYIRESAEDKGVLIVSRDPLTPILQKMGGHHEDGPEPHWNVPC